MTDSHTAHYARCINCVIKYIEAHLDGDLSIKALSAVANFSPHHFHRQFSAYTGIGVKTETGKSPTEFRELPEWAPWQFKTMLNIRREHKDMQVEIVDFPETLVAALEHRGPEHLTYNTTKKFVEWRQANGLHPGIGNTYGVHYTDPATTPPEDYRLDICLSVAEPVALNPQGVVTKSIPAGRCARVRHAGSRHHVHPAKWIYYKWLPQSGEQLRDYPIFFHYVNVGPEVKEHEMITDVYLPLK